MVAALEPGTFNPPRRRAETIDVPGLLKDPNERAEVTVVALDLAQRMELRGLTVERSLLHMMAVAVVYPADRTPIMDAEGWAAWSSRVSTEEAVRLLNKVNQLAGFDSDVGKP